MNTWLKVHSGHYIVIEYEDKSDIGIDRFWCSCRDCHEVNRQFDFLSNKKKED